MQEIDATLHLGFTDMPIFFNVTPPDPVYIKSTLSLPFTPEGGHIEQIITPQTGVGPG